MQQQRPPSGWAGASGKLRGFLDHWRLSRPPPVQHLPHPALRQPHPGRQLPHRHPAPVRRPQRRVPPALPPLPSRPASHRMVQHHRRRQQQPARRMVQPSSHTSPQSVRHQSTHTTVSGARQCGKGAKTAHNETPAPRRVRGHHRQTATGQSPRAETAPAEHPAPDPRGAGGSGGRSSCRWRRSCPGRSGTRSNLHPEASGMRRQQRSC